MCANLFDFQLAFVAHQIRAGSKEPETCNDILGEGKSFGPRARNMLKVPEFQSSFMEESHFVHQYINKHIMISDLHNSRPMMTHVLSGQKGTSWWFQPI